MLAAGSGSWARVIPDQLREPEDPRKARRREQTPPSLESIPCEVQGQGISFPSPGNTASWESCLPSRTSTCLPSRIFPPASGLCERERGIRVCVCVCVCVCVREDKNHPFFSFLATPWHMEFPPQGSDLRPSCDLCCSCGNPGSFNPLCQVRLEPASQRCRDAAHLIVPQVLTPRIILFTKKPRASLEGLQHRRVGSLPRSLVTKRWLRMPSRYPASLFPREMAPIASGPDVYHLQLSAGMEEVLPPL